MAGDDAGGDPEAEAGSVEVFGGVEGLVEACLDFWGHAVSGVGDGDPYTADTVGVVGGGHGGVVGADEEASSVFSHGVDGVGDEVVEYLADVVFEAEDSGVAGVVGVDVDTGVGESSLVEIDDCADEVLCGDVGGADGLAVEAEGLGGDLADTCEFALGHGDVWFEFCGEGFVDGDEVEEVGDGFEGVVDLVGDGRGEASDGGEFFGLDEGCFGFFLVGNFEGCSADPLDDAIGVEDREVVDVPVALDVGGVGGELAVEELVDDWFTLGDLLEHLLEAGYGGHFGEGSSEDVGGF